jgi:hypothetical protein
MIQARNCNATRRYAFQLSLICVTSQMFVYLCNSQMFVYMCNRFLRMLINSLIACLNVVPLPSCANYGGRRKTG